jgi:predicted dehydrogenase
MGEGQPIRAAVVGVGRFGRNHARLYHEMEGVELVGVYDTNRNRAAEVAAEYGCRIYETLDDLTGNAEAASVAVPTEHHWDVACRLMETGLDVLVEKPISRSEQEASEMIETAERWGRILQVGHLERFNPAVEAARLIARDPLFFEAHRLSPFSTRSLDVDVVLDLMIHDLDVVLSLVNSPVEEIRGVGLAVLSPKIDIANVRVGFEDGCVANFTASRVSTERVRKLRWFQAREYVSVDYDRQTAFRIGVEVTGEKSRLAPEQLKPTKEEPLHRQLENFLRCVRDRKDPEVDGKQAKRALELAHQILKEIENHEQRLRASRNMPVRKPQ